jgi:Protein of unknown function (DUF2889)
MSMREQVQNVSGPAGPSPLRRARSVRRTAAIDMTWPSGFGSQLRLDGHARDAVTLDPGRAPIVTATAAIDVGVGADRTIEDIRVDPERPNVVALVGSRGGGHLRSVLDDVLPGEREAGTPLYLLLDDISGTSLIAGFAWARHLDAAEIQRRRPKGHSMEGICIGFRPGSSALDERAGGLSHRVQPVAPLVHPDDPDGWHTLRELPAVSMRRARRIDVWLEGDLVVIDSSFQDSAGDDQHRRVAVHEYSLHATADRRTGRLLSLDAVPRVLPFLECPDAAAKAVAVVGAPLAELRAVVLARLAKTEGCTHLNDALRALAEVPVLVDELAAVA